MTIQISFALTLALLVGTPVSFAQSPPSTAQNPATIRPTATVASSPSVAPVAPRTPSSTVAPTASEWPFPLNVVRKIYGRNGVLPAALVALLLGLALLFWEVLKNLAGKVADLVSQLVGLGTPPEGKVPKSEAKLLGKVSFVYEGTPTYPILKFSIVNETDRRVTLTNLKVFKVACIKDEHGSVRHLMGPRVKLDYELSAVSEGEGKELLGARVSNLNTEESEAFEITLEAENSVALIDFDVECVAAGSPTTIICSPSEVVLVHAPVALGFERGPVASGDEGHIVTIKREQALGWVLEEASSALWETASYSECRDYTVALLRGAAALGISNPAEAFEKLRAKYEKGPMFGWVLASYADLIERRELPAPIVSYLREWVRDPQQLMRSLPSDDEVPATIVNRALATIARKPAEGRETEQDARSLEYALEFPDSTLCVPTTIDDPDDENKNAAVSDLGFSKLMGHVSLNVSRLQQLREVVKHAGKGAAEFLVAYILVQPDMFHEADELLRQQVRLKQSDTIWDQAESVKFWFDWWQQNGKPKYEQLQWRKRSPRLVLALKVFLTTDVAELGRYLSDVDDVVRFAAARNPRLLPDQMKELARDPRPMIRLTVVENPLTPLDILRQLAADNNSIVRRWIPNNPNADDALISQLENDPVAGVQEFARKARVKNP